MSMLNVSTESIDRVGRRETFLKSNFESLEGETVRPEKEVKNKNRYENIAVFLGYSLQLVVTCICKLFLSLFVSCC